MNSIAGKRLRLIGLAAVVVVSFSGCGTSNSSSSPNSPSVNVPSNTVVQKGPNGQQTMIEGGTQYSGKQKLQQFEKDAKSNPKSANAQMQAGISAFVNGDYTTAISYYKKVIVIDPKNGIAYNNIGNVYFRRLNQPKEALSYYTKATEVQPNYGYGWLNLALCQKALGENSTAKATVTKGLKVVPKSDPAYKALSTALGSK